MKRVFSVVIFVLLLANMLSLAFSIQAVNAAGTIYIRADGSIDPPSAPISTLDNVTYTLTGNVISDADGIVVERNNIVIDGAGYAVQGVGNGKGIGLFWISNVTVKNVKINTFENGILLWLSSNNVLTENTFSDCGLFVYDSYLNIVEGNTVNDKPLVYLEGVSSYNVGDAGQVILINCDHIQVKNLNLSETTVGVHLWRTNNSNIENNSVMGNSLCGFFVYYSSNNSISLNNITNNGDGIELEDSPSNTISENNITANRISGVELWDEESSSNNIVGNTISDNLQGIALLHSSYNSIYHNNFANNTYQVVSPWPNIWDDGYPSGGNYWSDYSGVDANGDGIGDTPYVIDADNKDRYPLMHPWSPLPVHNINTGLGYATIQEAIDAKETLNGHAIFVEAGTYHESIAVNKTISLIGENRNTTIIDGGGIGNLFCVTASNVKIIGFTVQGFGTPAEWKGGIYINYSSGNNVSGNILKDNVFLSISLHSSSGNLIGNNIITSNNGGGISLDEGSSGNTLVGNTILDLSMQGGYTSGIIILNSIGNTLVNNTISNVRGIGLEITQSGGSTLRRNQMSDNLYNFGVSGNYPDYINDIDDSNIIDGKPIYYWVSERDRAIPTDAGYVAVINSTNITVRDLDLIRNGEGSIVFHHTTSSIIENVTVSKTLGAISLRFSGGNTIRGNLLADNGNYGIELFASDNNVIADNTILNNSEREAILLWKSRYNTITGNTLKNNHRGTSVEYYSDGNKIYHNNFVGNTEQVDVWESFSNVWDDGYPSGGNYWSDYSGIDLHGGPYQNGTGSDGIGDTPYVIDAYNRDNYPLMHQSQHVPLAEDLNLDGTVDISDAILAALAFGSYPGHPRWNGQADLNQDSVVDIFDIIILASNFGKHSA